MNGLGVGVRMAAIVESGGGSSVAGIGQWSKMHGKREGWMIECRWLITIPSSRVLRV